MKIKSIAKVRGTGGNYQCEEIDINSLVVSSVEIPFTKRDRITVIMRDKNANTTICGNFSLLDFVHITDLHNGNSQRLESLIENLEKVPAYQAVLLQQEALRIGVTGTRSIIKYAGIDFPMIDLTAQDLDAIAEEKATISQDRFREIYQVEIDLGNIHLYNGTVLDIDIQLDSCHPEGSVRLAAISKEKSFDRIKKYTINNNMSFNMPNCEELYACFATLPDLDEIIQVTTDGSTAVATVQDLFAMSNLMGTTEVQASDLFVQVYEDEDGVPDIVCIQNQVSVPTYFIGVETIVDVRRVGAFTKMNAHRAVAKISKVEQADPQRAKALRYAGIIPKAAELSSAVKKMNG